MDFEGRKITWKHLFSSLAFKLILNELAEFKRLLFTKRKVLINLKFHL